MQCIFPDEIPLARLVRAGTDLGLIARWDSHRAAMVFEPKKTPTPAQAREMLKARNLADEWRYRFGYMYRGGFVSVYDGMARGWFLELSPAIVKTFCPGVVAVGSDGSYHIARGGDDQGGALRWEVWNGDAA